MTGRKDGSVHPSSICARGATARHRDAKIVDRVDICRLVTRSNPEYVSRTMLRPVLILHHVPNDVRELRLRQPPLASGSPKSSNTLPLTGV